MNRLSAAVDGARLWSRLMELGELGSTGDGGVNRQAMSDLDAKAHSLVASWAGRIGAEVSVDDFGNMFMRLDAPGENSILVGSHLDTQPTGGRFDGAYGVIAGLEVLEALSAVGARPDRPVELVVWNNEEGCRFAPTTMGSALAAGSLSLDDISSTRDGDGVSLADALAMFRRALGDYPHRSGKISGAAYVEAHIEQGPLLAKTGKPVAAVTGVQGIRQYRVTVAGTAAHAGTTPEAMRDDAFVSALALINRMRMLIAAEDDRLRFTIGSIKTEPNAINTIPCSCLFSLDLRHPREDVLDRFEAVLLEHARSPAIEMVRLLNSPAVTFDPRVRDIILESAAALGLACDQFASGATHDAKMLAETLPSGMIFIPCRRGLSHTPEEWAEPEHAAAGGRLLAEVVERLSLKKRSG